MPPDGVRTEPMPLDGVRTESMPLDGVKTKSMTLDVTNKSDNNNLRKRKSFSKFDIKSVGIQTKTLNFKSLLCSLPSQCQKIE